MKTNSQIIASCIVLLSLLLSSCGPEQSSTVLPTPSRVPTQTATPSPVPTYTATLTPPPASTPLGGASSFIFYEDGPDLKLAMPEANQGGVLVPRAELQSRLPKDRYLESVFGETGYGRIELFQLAPDGRHVLTDVCATLNDGRKCLYQYYVVSVDLSSIAELTIPGASSVSWLWSPDGKKLAGLAWAYGKYPFEEPVAYYVINSDGTGLTRIGQVPLNVYNMAWSSDSQTVYPLSLATHFRAMPINGSGEQEIEVEGLQADDQISCLQFSPDGSKVGFAATRDFPKWHYRIYTANPDFTNPTLVTEFDTDHHPCGKFEWSPNQDYILVGFENKPTSYGSVVDYLNFVFEAKTGEPVDIPSKSGAFTDFEEYICGWTPDGSLIYRGGGLALINVSNPDELTPVNLKHCPLLWLPQHLAAPQITNKLSSSLDPLICQPGLSKKGAVDDSVPGYIDMVEVNTELKGTALTVVFTLRDIPDDIEINLFPKTAGSVGFQAVFEVGIDADRRSDTGNFDGYEAVLGVVNLLQSGNSGNTLPRAFNLEGFLERSNPSNKEAGWLSDAKNISVDKDSNTITIREYIPGITPDASLTFRTYANVGADSYNAFDSLCD